MNRSKSYYIILVVTLLIILFAVKILKIHLLNILTYIFLFVGIFAFYSSNLKKHKAGIILGSFFFLVGSVLFVISKYELLNIGAIFIHTLLVIAAISFLTGDILVKVNFLSIILSTISLFAGLWLIINRGDATIDLFVSAAYSILKNYWIVILGVVLIIAGVTKFNRNDAK
jgi:hypothetical protein